MEGSEYGNPSNADPPDKALRSTGSKAGDGKRIKHLNLVLRAIRNVNQLIVREKDPGKLIQGVCENLTEPRGYYTAWIVLLDEDCKLISHAGSGLGDYFDPLIKRMEKGEFTSCSQLALSESNVVVIGDPASQCPECPLSDSYNGKGAITVGLEYGGKVFGLMSVSIPLEILGDDEERQLLKEVAGDVAFALHNIEVEDERRRVDDSLNLFKRIIYTAKESMAFIDREYSYKALNNAFGISKGSAAEMIDASVADLFGEEVFKGTIKPNLDRCLAGEDVNYQSWFEFPDLGSRCMDIFYYPHHDSSGSVIGVAAIMHDITESKRLEDERKHLLRQVELKNQELEQVVYATSHDLRSPMVNIQGFSKELQMSLDDLKGILKGLDLDKDSRGGLDKIIEEDIPKSFDYIHVSISKMDLQLKGLLRLSRLGREAVNIVDLDMNRIMSNIKQVLETRTKEKGAKLDIDYLLPCMGDERQINQVFSNLIENSLKYLDPERPGRIRVSGRGEKDRVVYCVEDNGIGIEPKNQKMVFNLFSRIDTKGTSGEGLGLTIVKKIVYRHGGEIWVESKPGSGSRFYVSLPIANKRRNGEY